jgi:hypothetical protein
LKKFPWFSGVLRSCKKAKRTPKENKAGETNSKRHGLEILKEPYFYVMVFLWLFAFCLAVYAILIGAIHPY